MNDVQVHELLYQALETELGGVEVYAAAIKCAQDDEFREELQKYHDQTTHHVELVQRVLVAFGLDLEAETPGRRIVRHNGEALVRAMELALADGQPTSAELVAAECVTLAETKDHLNWELLAEVVGKLKGEPAKVLADAIEEVEEQEDEHLYHSTGWGRELWIQSLGMKAVLPPPEEQKNVKTEIGAARAKQAREDLL